MGQHDRKPPGTTGDLEDLLVLDGHDGLEDGRFLPTVNQLTARENRLSSYSSAMSSAWYHSCPFTH